MAKTDFGIVTFSAGQTLTATHLNNWQGYVQAEIELRDKANTAESYCVSGLAGSIDAGNDEVDVASGEGYYDGQRYAGSESVAFTGGDASDTWYIYVDTADDTLKKATAWPSTVHLRICSVDWNGSDTLSNLVDERQWRRRSFFVPVDDFVLDGTNPPTGPNTGGTDGQCLWRQLEFENGADDIAFANFMLPDDYHGNLHVFVPFVMASVTTGEVKFEGTLKGATSGETLDAAGTANQNTSWGLITVPGTAGQLAIAELDFGNVTLARDDLCSLMLFRDVSDETSAAESADVVHGVLVTYE
ncbi:MAG: hypothetical protein PVH68_09880 [Armatimonadota bacterium]|jgi:hypothetical protein